MRDKLQQHAAQRFEFFASFAKRKRSRGRYASRGREQPPEATPRARDWRWLARHFARQQVSAGVSGTRSWWSKVADLTKFGCVCGCQGGLR